MGHKIISNGYIGSEPILRPAGQSMKLEFSVLSKRPTRPRGSTEYVDVIEAVRFIAWGEEAERLSEKLRPGVEVEAIGSQESSTFMNETTQKEETRVVYKLIHLDVQRRNIPQDQPNRQEQRQPQQGRQQFQQQPYQQQGQQQQYQQQRRSNNDGYDDAGGYHDGEPVPQRSHGGQAPQRNHYQGGSQRQQPQQQRYASRNHDVGSNNQSSGNGNPENRFSGVY
jgi:single-stranded DNA-binding protein